MSTLADASRLAPNSPYETVIEGFDALPEILQVAHAIPLEAVGVFDVDHGEGRSARWIARLLGLPDEGPGQPVRLTVCWRGNVAEWRRQIGNKILVTYQTARNGRIVESKGPGALELSVSVESGAIQYRQVALRCLGVPVPLCPEVLGKVTPDGSGWRVDVRISWRGKLVCCYGGRLEPL